MRFSIAVIVAVRKAVEPVICIVVSAAVAAEAARLATARPVRMGRRYFMCRVGRLLLLEFPGRRIGAGMIAGRGEAYAAIVTIP
jgi:hypothetical protein